MSHTHNVLPARVRVHLFTENRLLRESLVHLLLKKSSVSLIGVSDSMEVAADEITTSQCEVVLTDCLATATDTNLLRSILEQDPQPRIVLFGMEESFEVFLKAVHLGVSAYVLKDASASEVIGAVLAVAHGDAVCPPKLCLHLIEHLAQQSRRGAVTEDNENGRKHSLTHRQLELVSLLARGLTNKEIAANLHLSEFTVKNHMRRIMKQVDAGDRYEVVDTIRAAGVLLGP